MPKPIISGRPYGSGGFGIRNSSINILFLSVFFVSLSTLAFEVLLTRVFSVGQWNHLSFMVISIALFGFAAGGIFLSIIEIRNKAWLQSLGTPNWISILLYLYTLSTLLSFLAINHMPLDYFRLPVEPIQIIYLLAAYLLLALPFFFAGMIISIAYAATPKKSGAVYFASMAGSAIGAALPFSLLPLAGEGPLIILSASFSLLPAAYTIFNSFFKATNHPANHARRRFLGIAGIIACILMIFFILGADEGRLIQVKPSPYKALSQVLQFPETRVVETTTTIRGRFDHVKTPYIRYAPGLSLKYTDTLPGQDAVFKDGDNQLALYDIQNNPDDTRFAKHLLSYAAYYLRRSPVRVLLIVSGGGSSIPCAVASGAGQVSIVVESPQVAGILNRQYHHNIINQNFRAFLAQDNNDYDIIHIENWGTSIPGSGALRQEHFFTTEAFAEYLKHLRPEGIVTVSRKLLLPPSDSLRLWGAAYEAVKQTGIPTPAKHLAILRNFDTFTLIVSNSIIDFKRLAEFAEDRNFDPVFLPGVGREMANRYNIFDKPYHFEEINQLAEMYRTGRQDDFFRHYLLDVAPQSDRRPFPGRFMKWFNIKMIFHTMGSRLYALFMSGEIVVSIVFIEALFIALILLILPILVSTRGSPKPKLIQKSYFFAVGAGFMLIEIYYIKRIIILVGDPVISLSLVIAGILFFAGLGGMWVHKKPPHNFRLPLTILIPVLCIEVVGFELLVPYMLEYSNALRFMFSLLFLLPAGFLMGMPFPIGMRFLLDAPVQRAYAWSVNGCASVLSAIVAAQLAISWGIPQIAAAGIFAYLMALLSFKVR
jgi:hypothetical protein